MENSEIASVFFEMADILEMQNIQWKPVAYRKAARAIDELSDDVEDIYNKGGLKALEEISGVGIHIANKIEEFLKTGKIQSYEKLKKSIPKGLSLLLKVPGLGPKKAMILYKKLNIKNVKDLEKAALTHKISKLASFKEKAEENILKGLKIFKQGQERTPIAYAMFIAEEIKKALMKKAEKVEIAGSLRRMRDTVKDIDILAVSSKPKEIIQMFVSLPSVKSVIAKGDTKSSVLLSNNMQADLRVVPLKSFGAAMQYFTGSKYHNIKLRKIAMTKKLKLSEYGIFDSKGKQVAGKTEEEVYRKLGLSYIEPELRENTGEIEAALKGKLPKLVSLKDIQGDLHTHSTWSDGNNTIEEMALAAKGSGYSYIAITDHSKSEKIANGLSEKDVLRKLKEIEEVRKKIKGISILSGTEVNILDDGSLDYSDDLLSKLDVVVAAVHSKFKLSKQEETARIIKAISNPHVDIIGHLTTRHFGKREEIELDINAILVAAKKYNKIIEINCAAERMDIRDAYAKSAVEKGVMLCIDTDSHSVDELKQMRFGVGTARRGWCSKKDVLNTYSLKELMKFLKK
ncbi:MAG: DNA polymerase/3'-5' exonuclease PolX [Nanoarchaeota archaeon]